MSRDNYRPRYPILRLDDDGKPAYLKVDSPIFTVEAKSKGPTEWMDVTELQSGGQRSMRAQTVLANELRAHYPADEYVGRSFEIRKYKPQNGKRYATFSITEVRLIKQASSEPSPETVLAEISAELKQERHNPPLQKRSAETIDPLTLDYDEYLKTPLWRKIKRRVLKRDGKLCLRCGGQAKRVHHRSYADDVMLGEDDSKLASICEGCHTIIHFDESGRKRSAEETDRILLVRDKSASFPVPTIDMRKTRKMEYPPEWPRMSAMQRAAWHQDHNRLKMLHWVRLGKNTATVRRLLNQRYGMDDFSIDSEVANLRKRAVRKRKE